MIFNVPYIAVTLGTIGNAVSIFAVALGLFGLAGGAVGFFAKGRADAVIKGQAELIDVRDRSITDKEVEIAGLTAERDSLKNANSTLEGLAQGSPQLVALTVEIKTLTKTIIREMRKSKA